MSFTVNHAPSFLPDLTLDEAFPKVDANFQPFGERVLVQIRKAAAKTKGGIMLPPEVQKTEHSNTQVGKLISKGSLAFKNRDTGETWPEGEWAKIGAFVRAPKYGGDRFTVELTDASIEFVILKDTDLLGQVLNPLTVRSFL